MITGIIMAAGFSKRFGSDKLLLDLGGQSMIEKIIETALASRLDRLVLVYRSQEVAELAKAYDLEAIYNPRAHLGQAESVKLGVENSPPGSAYMFLVADQPLMSSEFLDHLIEDYLKDPGKILVPSYGARRGNPTIFPAELRDQLLQLEGDQGGRQLINKLPTIVRLLEVEDEDLGWDIDRPGDLESFKG